MSTSNGKITAPVTIGDVARTIGVASGDLGTLCTSGTIKKYSKDKPMHVKNKVNPLTDDDKKKANYGLNTSNRINDDIAIVVNESNLNLNLTSGNIDKYRKLTEWIYDKPAANSDFGRPTGDLWKEQGVLSYYRLSDFDGYYHYARPLVEIVDGLKLVDDNYVIKFRIATDSDGLTYENFNPLAHLAGNTLIPAEVPAYKDWNMNGWYINCFVISDNGFSLPDANVSIGVYGIGRTNGISTPIAVTDNDGNVATECEISIRKKELSHLMGTWFVCFVMSPNIVYYGKGENSFQIDQGTDYAIAYPQANVDENYRLGVFVENGIFELNFPDGNGIDIFKAVYDEYNPEVNYKETWYEGFLLSSVTFDDYEYADGKKSIKMNNGNVIEVHALTHYDSIYDRTYTVGFNLDIQPANIEKFVRRKFRSICFYNSGTKMWNDSSGRNDEFHGGNYLTADASSLVDENVKYKPLLNNLPARIDGTENMFAYGRYDFYLKFYNKNGARHQALMLRYTNTNKGTSEDHELFNSETTNGSKNLLGKVEFQNIVNVLTNKPEGFRTNILYQSLDGNGGQINCADENHPYVKYMLETTSATVEEFTGGFSKTFTSNRKEDGFNGATYTEVFNVNDTYTLYPYITDDYSVDFRILDDQMDLPCEPVVSETTQSLGGLYIEYDVRSNDMTV